ncbi:MULTISPECIES: metal-dependent hydrolase [unclassified Methanoregula]|uniref:metal-dependent hydrolase n=1 Tax=unclassified Methanoregula TaxID=2649730 RepID=UPI0009C69A89|nr:MULTISPECIES: metal-dependent hydrolase [unclassified Methanoregula]OPX64138.1 MAG: hypothetical protein A4E33_01162 [Methanoregula sp. PtaB.Bin085]OPY34742.1 MAG: hypothetical protein A4E34_01271 [Methanoregula sp. PtaU1.Bin006]
MMFFAHMVIGLIAGFILYEVYHDQNVIIFCAIGSVLPDIVDKPLGLIVLKSVLDASRIYFHSLVILFLFLLTGLFVWRYYHSNSFLCVALGIFLHQILDFMWNSPDRWFYPFLGPYQVEEHDNYFFRVLVSELSSPTEWVFLLAILVILLGAGISWYQKRPVIVPDPLRERQQHRLYSGLLGVAIFVLFLSLAIIFLWQPYQTVLI